MNRFSDVILPVSLCTSFLDYGGFMLTTTLILSGLALIPFTDTKQPRTLPSHAEHTFLRVQLQLCLAHICEGLR
jgi:hypothetical protein